MVELGKRFKWTIILLGLMAALLVGWFFTRGPEPTQTKKAPPPVPVLAAQAQLRDVSVVLDVVGRAEAYETVTIKSRVDGQIARIDFAAGQPVKAGDVLLRLESADFEAKVRQAEANLAKTQALLSKAKTDVERYTALVKQGFVSDEKLNEYRTNEASAQAAFRADQAALEVARLQASYTTIRAPIAGIVGAKLAYPGATVKTNDTALAVINRIQPLYATFTLPEQNLTQIRAILKQGVLEVKASLPGNAQSTQMGKLQFIDNAVDNTTGTILLKAVLPNRDESFAVGQFLNLTLVLNTVKDAVTVPAEAIQQGSDGNFVYLIDAEGKAALRKVVVLTIRDGVAAVSKGLAAGETVVTDGHLRLFPGAKTVIKENTKQAAAKKEKTDKENLVNKPDTAKK